MKFKSSAQRKAVMAKYNTLRIETPYGQDYKVNKRGYITQSGNNDYSKQWIFRGLQHTKRGVFIPFNELTQDKIDKLNLRYKTSGNPTYTVKDIDHGTKGVWGNTKYHGVRRIYWSKEK